MKIKFKMLAAVLIIAVVTSAFVIAVPTMAEETEYTPEKRGEREYLTEDEFLKPFGIRERLNNFRQKKMEIENPRLNLPQQFRKDATPTEVQGEISALVRNILILEDDDGVVEIIVPPAWIVDSEVGRLRKFIDEGPLKIGQEITVKALRADLTENEDAGYSIYVLFGYEIANSETTAYAVLPFNIEVSE